MPFTIQDLIQGGDGKRLGAPVENMLARVASMLGLKKADYMLIAASAELKDEDVEDATAVLPTGKFAAPHYNTIGSQIMENVRPGGFVIFPLTRHLRILTADRKSLEPSSVPRSLVKLMKVLEASQIHSVVVVQNAESFLKQNADILPSSITVIDANTIKSARATVAEVLRSTTRTLKAHAESEDFSPKALQEHVRGETKTPDSALNNQIIFIVLLLTLYRMFTLARRQRKAMTKKR